MSAFPEAAVPRPVLTARSPPPAGDGGEGEDECCRTPTSAESKLPPVARCCPAAPRKQPRWRARVCKRRLLLPEMELVAVGAEELEMAFRRREENCSVDTRKRKRSYDDGDGRE